MITLTVNCKVVTLQGPTILSDYVASTVNPDRMVAVGYNGEVMHRHEWGTVFLREGDVLDIVHMVGGGC